MTNASPPSAVTEADVRGTPRPRVVVGSTALLAVVVVALLAGAAGWYYLRTQPIRVALRRLASPDPETRRLGAWMVAHDQTPGAADFLRRALADGTEADPQVRESFAYALSRAGQTGDFDLIADLARTDTSAYVRQAAWVGAARLDPTRFAALVATTPERDEPWDVIGRAYGRLIAGDTRGVPDLLHYAAAGEPAQRQVATLALSRGVAPLLETAGRWPIRYHVREGDPWPAELIAEVARRCAEVDLQAIADDSRPHMARSAALHRNVGRLQRSREHIASYLVTP
jgi:nucleotide-binding universal stress UspA family protein